MASKFRLAPDAKAVVQGREHELKGELTPTSAGDVWTVRCSVGGKYLGVARVPASSPGPPKERAKTTIKQVIAKYFHVSPTGDVELVDAGWEDGDD